MEVIIHKLQCFASSNNIQSELSRAHFKIKKEDLDKKFSGSQVIFVHPDLYYIYGMSLFIEGDRQVTRDGKLYFLGIELVPVSSMKEDEIIISPKTNLYYDGLPND